MSRADITFYLGLVVSGLTIAVMLYTLYDRKKEREKETQQA